MRRPSKGGVAAFVEVGMDGLFLEYIRDLTDPFVNPQKRVFLGYLAIAFVFAIAVQTYASRDGCLKAVAAVLSRKVWFSRSAVADYKILLINQCVMMGIGPRLITKLGLATALFESLHLWLDGRVILFPNVPGWAIAALFSFALFLMDDVTKYLVHRALHRWPVLWVFHRVHHSAETLTPLTVYRTHPVEAVIFSLRGILVHAVVIGGFLYFFGSRVELVTILGANVFLFVFNVAGSNLRHSHVWISYGPILERLFISPAQHQIHHSMDARHHDRNFGAVLAIWDWMGGSLSLARGRQRLRFGVNESGAGAHSMKSIFLDPFYEAVTIILRLLTKDIQKMTTKITQFIRQPSLTGVLAFVLGISAFGGLGHTAELNIYSHRQPFLIQPFLDAYTKKTGTKINIVYASKGLAQRLKAEGARSPADVILTVDIARLFVYADKNLLATVNSEVLNKNVPAHLRDPGNRWFAFSKRARIVAVSKRAEDAAKIQRYEDLADPRWKGRICSRPGSHVYNRALVASIIHAAGVKVADAWSKGLVNNLARRPQGNDRAQVKAIYEGQCDIAIINNYYFGKLKHAKKPEQRDWAEAVTLIFPNQADRGTHVNISGGGIAMHSKNKVEAKNFLEFLTTKTAQDLYAAVNFEYPVNSNVPLSEELKSWGVFIEDRMPISRVAELAPEAQRVIDRAGW